MPLPEIDLNGEIVHQYDSNGDLIPPAERNAYVADEEAVSYGRSVLERIVDENHPVGIRRAPEAFTFRETAEIIRKSYHVTRNLALSGAFGALIGGDEGFESARFVDREGLRRFLQREATEKGAEYNNVLVALGNLDGVPFEDINLPAIRDVTDETANFAQAVQNIASAFEALAETTTRHHTETEDAINAATETNDQQYGALRTLVEGLRASISTSEQVGDIRNELSRLRAEMGHIRAIVSGPLPRRSGEFDAINAMGYSAGASAPTIAPPAASSYIRPPRPSPGESAPVREPAAPTQIETTRPDQIVTIANGRTTVDHRTRNAMRVGDLVVLDAYGVHPARAGDPATAQVGIVTTIRDALPHASEVIQPVMELTMRFSDRREILHPTRNETCVVTTNRSGVPAWETANDHFQMISWRTVHDPTGGSGRTMIHWRPS